MKRDWFVLHPFLFAIFPALSIVSDHIRFLSFNNTILGLTLINIIVTFLCLSLLQLRRVERLRAGLIVSLSLLLFFSYGHIYSFIAETFPGFDIRHRYLFFIWLLFALVIIYLLNKATKNLPTYSRFLNITGACLVLLSLGQIVSYRIVTRNAWEPMTNFITADTNNNKLSSSPDIYYIILDTYGSAKTLQEFYNFGNNEFLQFLQNKGFFVVEDGFSNYAVTTLSLASSLNMDYLDKLSPNLGTHTHDLDYEIPKQMIENNNVMRFLKSRGYNFIFFGSGKGISQQNRYADQQIKCGYIDETMGRIIQSTLLWPIAEQFQLMTHDDRAQRLCVFAKLAEMPKMASPKFVFAHILAPHAPFLFEANGDPVRFSKASPEQNKEHYVNQMIFINSKVEQLVAEILAESEVEPIIILQGDTGPPYGYGFAEARQDSNEDVYKQNMRILNTYHLPNNAKEIPSGLSPVNTFRLIFNLYFDTDFPLLENQSYFSTGNDPYHFINVTRAVD